MKHLILQRVHKACVCFSSFATQYPLEIMKNAFNYIKKAFFVFKTFHFLHFYHHSFFPCQSLLEKIIEDKF